MNKNELNEVVQDLLKRIRELPDGSSISTAILVEEAYNNPRDLRDSLMEIHFALLDAAKKEGIKLDMSEYDDKAVGLPYNLNYVIRHGRKT